MEGRRPMKRDLLLLEIAQTAYNIGYGAKKNLATYDILEKAPGWIVVATLGVGIFALFNPTLENKYIAAAVLLVGIGSLYFNFYQSKKAAYADVGSRLTSLFTSLRSIYYEVKSEEREQWPDSDELVKRYRQILDDSQEIGIARQIFLSDWYAHYKFFWQAQTDWINEQLHFRFWRDRIPLTATIVGIAWRWCLFGPPQWQFSTALTGIAHERRDIVPGISRQFEGKKC
jgi:hypothetical protein